ncbi:MAG TPA: ABC transporter permease, partial [Acidimicrobiia bacterium]|nr:ABC transporter permease [Acidimicrobiia bacterium]
MKSFLPFLIIGIATGAVYALAAMGLVVTYTTSGVFNFAHGAAGMFAAYIFYTLRVDVGVPTWLAAAVAVLLVAPAIGVLIDRVLLQRFVGGSASSSIVVSLGLLVALQGTAVAIYGGETRSVAPLFPTSTFELAGVRVGYDQVIVVAIALAAALGLTLFFRRTQLGLKTQAVVGDRALTGLVGVDARAVTTFSWVLGSAFAALSGVLFAPFVGLDSILLTLLVVQAFGAAVIGGLRNLTLANAGAYGVGIAAALSTKWVATVPSLRGLPSSIPFLVLFLVLVASPKGRFTEVGDSGAVGLRRSIGTSPFPWRLLVSLTAVGVVLPSVLSPATLLTASATVIFVLMLASLGLLVGLSRQVSLCHAVFAVFGATTLSHLQTAGLPYGLALVLAGLAVVPVGALIAIPAIRLSGLFLALATFGFGVLAESLLFNTAAVFGSDGVAFVARPSLFQSDRAFYYFALGVVVLGLVVIETVRRTRLGRILRAMADSPVALQSIRVNPTASRVMVFCLSAFLAAVAGGLLGSLIRSMNLASFGFFQSLIWLTVLVAAGASSLGGAVLAALLLVTGPAVFTAKTFAEWQPVAFGLGAMVLAQAPNG